MKKKLSKYLLTSLETFVQKVYISCSLYAHSELHNHAGAVAYFFLLSIIPLLLLFIYIFNSYLQAFPEFSEQFFVLLTSFNEHLDSDFLERVGIVDVSGGTLGVFGLIYLLWISRLIMKSVQRAFMVIFPSTGSRSIIMTGVLSFIIVPVLFCLVILSIVINFTTDFFYSLSRHFAITQSLFDTTTPIFSKFLPFLIAFLIIFLSYRYLPVDKQTERSAFQGSILCTISIFILKTLFTQLFDVAKLNIFYGVIGTLILTLMWVYFVFVLYFLFAQYTYVTCRFDVLVLDRMFFLSQKKAGVKRIESFLFRNPLRILNRYGKRYQPRDVIFHEGDDSKNIFYLYKGKIGIYKMIHGENIQLTTFNTGEIFGEMAYLLKETRTASVVAESRVILFIFKPEMFEELLKVNHVLSRNTIHGLCQRLNKMNIRSDSEPELDIHEI